MSNIRPQVEWRVPAVLLLCLFGVPHVRGQCGPDGAMPFPPGESVCPVGGGNNQSGGDNGGAGAASCATDGSDYAYSEAIVGQSRVITTSYCPNAPFKNINPNYPVKDDTTYTVPAYPKLHTSSTDLTAQGGSAGVLFNAAQLFSPYGGPNYGAADSYAKSAAYAEGHTFDACGCHASQTTSASYHCHTPPSCLLRQLGTTSNSHSPQIGWASDGFPVYGPRGRNGIMMQTCTLSETGSISAGTCTDDDGGLQLEMPDVDSYKMRYYVLGDYHDGASCENPTNPLPGADYHPSTPTAYKGCCPSGVSCSASFLPTCTSAAEDGYVPSTGSFVAAAAQPNLSTDCTACWSSSEHMMENALCANSQ
eukprot:CAMPEP_0117655996 /NCGR_PEP_ID=MMETSP0804-20121206/4570_1 /TAXON_ID=1074897 /ORGANISM="Tetraselmis astigmatica, Strain CCMP880" /LENGTH=363 /DNA_ID=CAMNT_0005462371 /DNA_START=42 /DNA_END=1130 /DNA_ORIENTATION=+